MEIVEDVTRILEDAVLGDRARRMPTHRHLQP